MDIEKETINFQKILFKNGILDFSNNCTLKKTPNLERLLRPQIPRMYIHFRIILFVHKAKFLIVHNIIFIFFLTGQDQLLTSSTDKPTISPSKNHEDDVS